MSKVNIDQVLDEVTSIQNQISGLNLLLSNKKQMLAHYFEKTGNRSVENEDCSCYVQERTNITYDMEALRKALSKPQLNSITDVKYSIRDWKGFISELQKHDLSPKLFKPYISVDREVNPSKLNSVYEKGELSLSDISNCYTATVKKSVAIRMKHASNEIPVKK